MKVNSCPVLGPAARIREPTPLYSGLGGVEAPSDAGETSSVRTAVIEPRGADADIAQRGQSGDRVNCSLSVSMSPPAAVQAASATTGLRSTPIPLISTSATSPGPMKSGGLRLQPTPPHVPDTITSPGSSGRMVEI